MEYKYKKFKEKKINPLLLLKYWIIRNIKKAKNVFSNKKKPMASETPYTKTVNHFNNTSEFRYLAEYFEKNKAYTLIPSGTAQYKEFWEECREKCLNGMTNSSDIYINGYHFFYLNFVQIMARNPLTNKKEKMFPSFVDLDWEYFQLVQYARENEKSVVTVKGRRQGYSYKAANVCIYEFTFFPQSSCLIGAYFSKFSENTMNMVIDNSNFLNKNTEFKKQRNPDTRDEIRARYQAEVGGTKVWKGTNSSVEQVTFKSNEFAAVGKSATWLVLDEAGVFPNIIQTYNMSEPLIKDGAYYTGSCLMFGSAGSMENGSQYFEEIFTSPSKYNMLEFDEPTNSDKKIGLFSSAARGRWGKCRDPKSVYYGVEMVDKDGNSNIEAATEDILWERENKKRSSDHKAFHDFITQFPLNYREAFLRSKGSIFPTQYCNERLAELETNNTEINAIWKTKLIQTSDGVIEFSLDYIHEPIREFPIKDNKNMPGCIEIFEMPYQDTPNFGVYIAGIDPYDDDESQTNSLGSVLIMNTLTNRIVAEYTGRPQTAKDYYENVRRLLIYYNAVANYENNKKGLFAYFENKNCLHLLCNTPRILKDQQLLKMVYSSGNNMKGTTATEQVNKYARELVKTWMYEAAYSAEDGVTNTHTIKSIALLKELIFWNSDGNFDRVSALMMLMILKEDRFKLVASEEEDRLNNMANHPFFTKHYGQQNNIMANIIQQRLADN